MKDTPIKDFYTTGTIRKEDGRGIHDMFLMQVKSAKESTEPWDYYKVVTRIPGEEAFTKLADSKCPLVKK
jgi:branched-chain amino acid transport system substrate-binding protein